MFITYLNPKTGIYLGIQELWKKNLNLNYESIKDFVNISYIDKKLKYQHGKKGTWILNMNLLEVRKFAKVNTKVKQQVLMVWRLCRTATPAPRA